MSCWMEGNADFSSLVNATEVESRDAMLRTFQGYCLCPILHTRVVLTSISSFPNVSNGICAVVAAGCDGGEEDGGRRSRSWLWLWLWQALWPIIAGRPQIVTNWQDAEWPSASHRHRRSSCARRHTSTLCLSPPLFPPPSYPPPSHRIPIVRIVRRHCYHSVLCACTRDRDTSLAPRTPARPAFHACNGRHSAQGRRPRYATPPAAVAYSSVSCPMRLRRHLPKPPVADELVASIMPSRLLSHPISLPTAATAAKRHPCLPACLPASCTERMANVLFRVQSPGNGALASLKVRSPKPRSRATLP